MRMSRVKPSSLRSSSPAQQVRFARAGATLCGPRVLREPEAVLDLNFMEFKKSPARVLRAVRSRTSIRGFFGQYSQMLSKSQHLFKIS